MKVKALLLSLVIATSVFTACGNTAPAASVSPSSAASSESAISSESPAASESAAATETDATSSASIVDTAAAFELAISKDGNWIICTTKDLTIDNALVLDGEFKNGEKDDAGTELIQRKIALYTQDADRNITARFTLTAPKLTINSPMASIQHGTFKGDVYVSVINFELVDAKIDGNLYFASEEIKTSFKMDDKSSVTGTQEVKQ